MTAAENALPVRVCIDRRREAAARRLAGPAGAGRQHRLVLRVHAAIPRPRSRCGSATATAASWCSACRPTISASRNRDRRPRSSSSVKPIMPSTFRWRRNAGLIGAQAHPFYRWIADTLGEAGTPRWNFHKFLIAPDGELAGAWPAQVAPDRSADHREIDRLLPPERLRVGAPARQTNLRPSHSVSPQDQSVSKSQCSGAGMASNTPREVARGRWANCCLRCRAKRDWHPPAARRDPSTAAMPRPSPDFHRARRASGPGKRDVRPGRTRIRGL